MFAANFSFLYMFCPCIVAPGTVWPSLSPGPAAKRCLVLVAKLLMNLASGVMYGAKEQHMMAANPFIAENKGAMHVLYHELEVRRGILIVDAAWQKCPAAACLRPCLRFSPIACMLNSPISSSQAQCKREHAEEEPSLDAIGEGAALQDEQVVPLARALHVLQRGVTALPQVLKDVPSIASACQSIHSSADSAVSRSGFVPVVMAGGKY